jgi:uncharacterized protein (DUF3820 family)
MPRQHPFWQPHEEGEAMTFKEAAAFVMPFGKNKGRTLDDIASDDDGLLYLDWLRGERDGSGAEIDDALESYLDDPTIQKELERIRR